jgi:leucyl-tRNA synthetase
MEQVNALHRYLTEGDGARRQTLDAAVDTLTLLLAPMIPHVTAELWERRHPGAPSVHAQQWPVADPAKLAVESVTMVVQVNGKPRDRIEVDPSISEDAAIAAALASPKVAELLAGAAPKKVVARPPRIVNVVV